MPDRIGFSVDAVTLNITGANEDAAATGDLDITDGMTTINGGGVVIGTDADAANNTGFDDRVFHVLGGATATIDGVTIRNGRSSRGYDFFDSGGGILNNGTLNLSRSTVSGNSAGGDVGFGGGICNNGGTLTLTSSTVSGNTATFGGGGVFTARSLTRIENSTITDNTALPDRGSGVAGFDARTEVSSSIVAANENTDVDFALDDTGTFSSGNYNLIGDGNATGEFDGSGDQTNVSDPRLGHLADNGGPTKTHALLAGSPAIDKGNTDLTVDQRGEPRPFDDPNIPPATGGDDSDIGAFEAQEVLNRAPDAKDDNPTTNEDTPASVNVLSNDTDPDTGDDLDIARFGQGQNGSVTCNTETGECTYTPDDDFNGEDSFTYTASDGEGGEDTATVTITVNAVNDAPTFTKGGDQTVAEDAGPQSVPGWATGISAGPFEVDSDCNFHRNNNNNALFLGPAANRHQRYAHLHPCGQRQRLGYRQVKCHRRRRYDQRRDRHQRRAELRDHREPGKRRAHGGGRGRRTVRHERNQRADQPHGSRCGECTERPHPQRHLVQHQPCAKLRPLVGR